MSAPEPKLTSSDWNDLIAKLRYCLAFLVILVSVGLHFGWLDGLAVCSAIWLLAPFTPFGEDPSHE